MNRKKWQLLLVVTLFALPLLAAWIGGAIGWRPEGSRAHGTLLNPPLALREARLVDESGEVLPWRNAESAWHVFLIAPSECDARCAGMVDTLHRVWRGLNRHARRVEVHFHGIPDAAAREAMKSFPQMHVTRLEPDLMPIMDTAASADVAAAVGLPVLLFDPNGYLVMRFDAGFDPTGLRRDLYRLVR
ncbi:MAG TPA: hypothetical protein PKZ76_10200 [Xanthomonadaceae bacterium]|nr:hypothetical protein [Xanthomonadaceae bacterium]